MSRYNNLMVDEEDAAAIYEEVMRSIDEDDGLSQEEKEIRKIVFSGLYGPFMETLRKLHDHDSKPSSQLQAISRFMGVSLRSFTDSYGVSHEALVEGGLVNAITSSILKAIMIGTRYNVSVASSVDVVK